MKRNHLDYLKELSRTIFFTLQTRLEQNPGDWVEVPEDYLKEKITLLADRFEELLKDKPIT